MVQRYKDSCHVLRTRCVLHHSGLIQPSTFHTAYAEEHHQIKANTQISLLANAEHSRLNIRLPDPTLSDVPSTHRTPSYIHQIPLPLQIPSRRLIRFCTSPLSATGQNHRSSCLRLLLAGVAPWRSWRHNWGAEVLPASTTSFMLSSLDERLQIKAAVRRPRPQ